MNTTRPSLLLRIRNREDGDAWDAFHDIYRPMLFRFARARGLSDADSEDVAQQCLAAIASRIATFDYDPSRGRFKAWLRTLVNNHVRNMLRARRAATAGSTDFDSPQQRELGPDEEFERHWLEEHLRHCLQRVREEVGDTTYAAFEQYVIEERPADEVARSVGVSVDNLYTIKWRLTQKIAERMRELTGEDS